ncbi:hypothetical protein KIL84_012843 [Mauremys mutica]|uniref:Uncharacterized protein n=1 Tax=Mauremys mutica TaxID=74926 RepID=A0A9D4B1R5_9SAUR|nr:hypothetical protein KIL84_012843 [Mauremys mutica]
MLPTLGELLRWHREVRHLPKRGSDVHREPFFPALSTPGLGRYNDAAEGCHAVTIGTTGAPGQQPVLSLPALTASRRDLRDGSGTRPAHSLHCLTPRLRPSLTSPGAGLCSLILARISDVTRNTRLRPRMTTGTARKALRMRLLQFPVSFAFFLQ